MAVRAACALHSRARWLTSITTAAPAAVAARANSSATDAQCLERAGVMPDTTANRACSKTWGSKLACRLNALPERS